jgi:hypothetical protein
MEPEKGAEYSKWPAVNERKKPRWKHCSPSPAEGDIVEHDGTELGQSSEGPGSKNRVSWIPATALSAKRSEAEMKECGAFVEWCGQGKLKYWRKILAQCHFVYHQSPHGLTSDGTKSSVVRSKPVTRLNTAIQIICKRGVRRYTWWVQLSLYHVTGFSSPIAYLAEV